VQRHRAAAVLDHVDVGAMEGPIEVVGAALRDQLIPDAADPGRAASSWRFPERAGLT
jgi:hypothetical protein